MLNNSDYLKFNGTKTWGGDGVGLIWGWCGGGVGVGLGWRSGGVGRCGLAPGWA